MKKSHKKSPIKPAKNTLLWHRKLTALGGFILPLVLLLWVFKGDILSKPKLTYPIYSQTIGIATYDSTLVAKIRSLETLDNYIKDNLNPHFSDRKKADLIFHIVDKRIFHGHAQHTFESNYLLWALGKTVHPAFGSIYDASTMLKFSNEMICSQASYLLMQVSLKNNLKARHVGLGGHVVTEIWYDGDWHMYDPDFGVKGLWKNDILSVEELSRNRTALENIYKNSAIIEIYLSRIDNTFNGYPVGVYFEMQSEILRWIEKFFQILKYLLPLTIMGIYGIIWRKRAL